MKVVVVEKEEGCSATFQLWIYCSTVILLAVQREHNYRLS